MPRIKPRTKNQNAYFHSLLSKQGFDAEAKAELVFDITKGRTEHSSEMSFDEMNFGIERLGGTPFPVISSRRTLNYHRQQSGNVDEIISPEAKEKIAKLCRKGNISDVRLKGISNRACGKDFPLTVKHGQKVIEALKNIVKREAEKGRNPHVSKGVNAKKEAA